MVNSFHTQVDQIVQEKKKTKHGGCNRSNGTTQYLNFGEDDEMEIQGFVCNKMKTRVIWLFYVLTLGGLRLFFHWYPQLHLRATHSRSCLKSAEKVLIIDAYKKFKCYFVKEVKLLAADVLSDAPATGHGGAKETDEEKLLRFNLRGGRKKSLQQIRIIKCKKLTYIWDEENNIFAKLAGFDHGVARTELHSFTGQTKEKQILKRIIYGNNEINVPVQTILTLLVLEALTPFYIFQLFSLIVWISEPYLYYATAIIIMSVVGITTSIIQTRKNQKNLKGTVHSADTAVVCRGGNVYDQILTTDLVPGDLIVIPTTGCEMQCDAVLLSGNCVVNESMLTGESVPITKTPLPNNSVTYNVKADVNHTLFCGTKIIQTRVKGDEKVLAVVIRTGYLTAKGELVRSILYPPPADFKFETDSYKFIGILFFIALLGVIYTIVSKTTRRIYPSDILIKALDVITIAVPPALPAAMTVGKLYALTRLKNSQIFCINSRVINVSGSVDCICFDKTGTLTEDELDMWGVVCVENNEIKPPLKDTRALPATSSLLRGMATCHSLSIINNELGGDPLDVKMFEATGWVLEDTCDTPSIGDLKKDHLVVKPKRKTPPGEEKFEIGIVKQFQFASNLQRMSVIVDASDSGSFGIFCKGSPEMIISLSDPSSVPADIFASLREYTGQGYRVIALAERTLEGLTEVEVESLDREDVERDLEFVGLIVLENKLKTQTTGIIGILKDASMKVVMITGDNIQTALHIAKECKMVDPDQMIVEVVAEAPSACTGATVQYYVTSAPTIYSKPYQSNGNNLDIEKNPRHKYCFALTGNSWANVVDYFPDLLPKIVAKGTVFARMSGIQKQQLIEEFKSLGYYVAMCGDGANDCGALKAAHVGVSLSEAESSVASPFTSKQPNISCMPKVIKEGRAALVTSFGVFKMMLCYSLTELASVLILYYIDSNLTSSQFLFIDICLVLNFASFFGMTKAYETLDKTPPPTSLMGFVPISSMVLFMLLATGFQLFAYYWIKTYSWFEPFKFNQMENQNFLSYENYAVFCVSMFQYITMAVVFSKGKPYRKCLYTNILLTFSLLIMTVVCSYLTLVPADPIKYLMELKMPQQMNGRYAMIVIAAVCFAACFVMEDFVVEFILAKVVAPKFHNIDNSKQKFLRILRNLNEDPSWPKINEDTVILDNVNEKGNEKNGLVNKGFIDSQEDLLVTKC